MVIERPIAETNVVTRSGGSPAHLARHERSADPWLISPSPRPRPASGRRPGLTPGDRENDDQGFGREEEETGDPPGLQEIAQQTAHQDQIQADQNGARDQVPDGQARCRSASLHTQWTK